MQPRKSGLHLSSLSPSTFDHASRDEYGGPATGRGKSARIGRKECDNIHLDTARQKKI
jgi:hypothetical protein